MSTRSNSELLIKAEQRLAQAIDEKRIVVARAYDLDSIAASLLVLARNSVPVNITNSEAPLNSDDVELIVRRLVDGAPSARKSAKSDSSR